MKIGIIGAMDEEISILKGKMSNLESTTIAGCEFHQGSLHGQQVILTLSGIGKVAASIASTLLLDKFKPDYIINTGSAGGFDKKLNVGDIIISKEVRFHDVDLTAFGYEIGQMAQLPAAFQADPTLINIAQQATKSLPHLTFTQGLICTGDIFMADPKKTDIARQNFPDMLACEMEAAAIAQVCYQFKIPFVIIRSLSDIAGKKSEVSFDKFLPIAAKNSSMLIEEMLKRIA
ncbi:5'-methylthioadenosine/S-adenosylhomocysteine nucleosidase [Psychromonas sp. CD1]|uniref:5'-methylthioadenosine/S-adenosylhomocysteine nucleosidase n=1 Tax=Psychromonas sp. CD1 TaxID=1979839 RepID=UPI000B9BAD08|nr:5'-methylthioadenosine/S-adenosylhomocysteine nucleosidase [Psychromonas sp. CD1]